VVGQDIAISDGNDVWVALQEEGSVLYRHGGEWRQIEVPGEFLRSLSLVGGGGWLVGDDGILTLQDGTWVPDERLGAELVDKVDYLQLRRVYATSLMDAWAVGLDGNIVHFDGGMWHADRRGDGFEDGSVINWWHLQAVDVIADGRGNADVWAAGDSETLLRRHVQGLPPSPTPAVTPVPTTTEPPPLMPVCLPYVAQG
jgi:hypothetical protein